MSLVLIILTPSIQLNEKTPTYYTQHVITSYCTLCKKSTSPKYQIHSVLMIGNYIFPSHSNTYKGPCRLFVHQLNNNTVVFYVKNVYINTIHILWTCMDIIHILWTNQLNMQCFIYISNSNMAYHIEEWISSECEEIKTWFD